MQGPSHLIISWFAAEAAGLRSHRDRRIVALSGLAPDIDVLAYLGAIVYFGFNKELAFEHVWQVAHHRYTHGLGFVLMTGIIAFIVASRGIMRIRVFVYLSLALLIIAVFAPLGFETDQLNLPRF